MPQPKKSNKDEVKTTGSIAFGSLLASIGKKKPTPLKEVKKGKVVKKKKPPE